MPGARPGLRATQNNLLERYIVEEHEGGIDGGGAIRHTVTYPGKNTPFYVPSPRKVPAKMAARVIRAHLAKQKAIQKEIMKQSRRPRVKDIPF